MVRSEGQNKLIADLKIFINSLVFEDAGTALNKTYKWMIGREEKFDGFNIDVDLRSGRTVNMLVRFSKDDEVAFTIFEGK